MIFADLVAGSAIFLDANILVFHFQPHAVFGQPCTDLLKRIENQQLTGYISTHVLSEVAHRLMTFEAFMAFGWPSKIVNRLKQNPGAIHQLTRFRAALQKVPQMGIQILTIPTLMVETAAGISQQNGLLTNDALIVAVMQANAINNLASEDSDFDRVAGITRYTPV
jgi:predicted nucleic acid-binding protein